MIMICYPRIEKRESEAATHRTSLVGAALLLRADEGAGDFLLGDPVFLFGAFGFAVRVWGPWIRLG